jgi:hypothetical protein
MVRNLIALLSSLLVINVVHQCCFTTGFLKPMLRPYFRLVIAHVKSSCEKYVKALVDELEGRFLNHELMLALGAIDPNFWAPNLDKANDDFHQCLIVIKATYCSPRNV